MIFVLYFAIVCGVVGAITGNRTSWALLASVGLCLLSDQYGWYRPPLVLALIDVVVMSFILSTPQLKISDIFVVVLFFPALAAYTQPAATRDPVLYVVVVLQLMLTFPLRQFWYGLKASAHDLHNKGDFDLRVKAT